MDTRLCFSISKDNGFIKKSVSFPLNSGGVSGCNSGSLLDPVAGSDDVVSALAYKYNGKPNYTDNLNLSTELKTHSISHFSEQSNYTTAVATIDWLSITFCVSLPSKDEDFADNGWLDSSGRLGIKLQDRRVQHYRYFGICYLDGVKFGEISFCPHEGSVLQSNYARLKVDNELFYSNEWYQYITEFKELTGATYNNVSRLDIAIDYSGGHGQGILNFVRSVKSGNSSYRKLGVRNMEYISREGYNDSFTVGRRSGNKYAVFYNKSLDIREHSNKEYIANYHRANGLDTSQDVFRFELRLDSEAVKSVDGFRLEKLTDVNYLLDLVKTHINNWFEFVPSIAANVSRLKRFDILRLESIFFAVSYLDRVKRKVHNSSRTVKVTVKCLLEQLYLNGLGVSQVNHFLVASIRHLVDNSGLSDWLDYRFSSMIDSFNKKLRFICEPAISVNELASLLNVSLPVKLEVKQAVA